MQSADHALDPPLPRSGTGQHPGENSHHSELFLGPVNTWRHALGSFPWQDCWCVQTTSPTGRRTRSLPSTWPLGWLWKLMFFLKCTAPLVLQCMDFKRHHWEPFQKMGRVEGCWCLGLAKCIEGRCSKAQELESPGVEEITCHQLPRGWLSRGKDYVWHSPIVAK